MWGTPDTTGVGPIPMNRDDKRRLSAAVTHLYPAAGRANLEVRGDAPVDRVVFDGDRARSVVLAGGETLDDLLVDRICAASPSVNVWPGLDPLEIDLSTPPAQRVLALTGRPPGLWVDASDPNCATGQC